MGDLAIRVAGLGKRFRLHHEAQAGGYRTLREDFTQLPRRFWSKIRGAKDEEFWALKDVSFEVKQGEIVGVIGRNGSGKSTLLKILSRITPPTVGEVDLYGRVGSLLEVGTGFHPELTGRENIYLSGALLGMRGLEIRRRFDEIVAFSGVEKFLDTPCKHYSSGMFLRLGFAVAAHLDAEILLVDEVLAVGDAEFQRKCLGKMGDVAQSGRAVLFVSHNLNVVQQICQTAVLLDGGELLQKSSTTGVIGMYLRSVTPERVWPVAVATESSGGMEFSRIRISGYDGVDREIFTTEEGLRLSVEYEIMSPMEDLRIVVQFLRGLGDVAFTSTDHRERNGRRVEIGRYASVCEIPGGLLNLGRYSLIVWAGMPGKAMVVAPFCAGSISIEGCGNHGSDYADASIWPGAVCPKLRWRVMREP